MSESKFRLIHEDEDLSNFIHGCHILLYAQTSKIALSKYNTKALVLMQLRFDGCLGFPGGVVDEGESPEEAVTREMKEEINYDKSKFGEVKKEHHIFSHVDEKNLFVSHFFAKEIRESDMNEILRTSSLAKEVFNESLGVIFVPLYTMKDSYRGFPAFLKNNFIGNAKYQLTSTLVKLNILTREEVEKALIAIPPASTTLNDE